MTEAGTQWPVNALFTTVDCSSPDVFTNEWGLWCAAELISRESPAAINSTGLTSLELWLRRCARFESAINGGGGLFAIHISMYLHTHCIDVVSGTSECCMFVTWWFGEIESCFRVVLWLSGHVYKGYFTLCDNSNLIVLLHVTLKDDGNKILVNFSGRLCSISYIDMFCKSNSQVLVVMTFCYW